MPSQPEQALAMEVAGAQDEGLPHRESVCCAGQPRARPQDKYGAAVL